MEDLQTTHVDSIDALIERAIEVIGDAEEAMRWLGTPVRALGYATPIAVLSKPDGKASVLAALSRLEHGVM
jgi:putative toxin-antitoxin system antitoxin component (TIGR02293 family)